MRSVRMSSTSRKPAVPMSPVRAPLRSRIAFEPMVVPCRISDRSLPPSAVSSNIPAGLVLVHRPRGSIHQYPVIVARGGMRNQLVAEVAQHAPRFALEWITPTAGARNLMAENVAALDHRGELARQDAFLRFRVDHVERWLARPAAIKPERAAIAAIGAHLQDRLALEEPVFAIERRAAAILSGSAAV